MIQRLLLSRAAPVLFALLWSTGWIAAGAAAPYADPLTFLSLRFALAVLALAILALASGAAWPTSPTAIAHSLIAGISINAVYLGCVWWAVAQGVPAGISGVIAAAQPVLTAGLAPLLLGERLSRLNWLGVLAGFSGIVMVLQPKLAATDLGTGPALGLPLAVNLVGMLSVTLGTLYQKRFVPAGDLRTMTLIQYLGSLAVILPAAWWLEPMRLQWTPTLIATMAWSVLALSLGGVALFLWLIRQGAVSRAASLIYLVPPAAVLEAWLLFGETLVPLQMAGIAVTVAGVALAVRK